MNPAHQDLSNNTKGTFQFLWNCRLRFNLTFSDEIIQYSRTFACKSKCHGTKSIDRSSSRAFQQHQEHDLKHPGSVDLITTKQNKQPSFIDRDGKAPMWHTPLFLIVLVRTKVWTYLVIARLTWFSVSLGVFFYALCVPQHLSL